MNVTAEDIKAAITNLGGPYLAANGEYPYTRNNFTNMLIEGDCFPTAERPYGSGDIEVPGIGIAREVERHPNYDRDDYQGPTWLVFSLADKFWRITGEYVIDPQNMYVDHDYGNLWDEDGLHEVFAHTVPSKRGPKAIYTEVA